MTTILMFALPLFGWTFVLASVAAHFANNLFYFAAVGFNLIALWVMRTPATSDLIWTCLFCAVAIAILLVIDRVGRDHDLLMPVYAHWLSRTLLLATTLWWFAGLIFR
ncbi:hypothetical protein [Lacticaseibacillus daqingensis]|uniref:hypothetical protein n=1 Tax=Lacticaseibacillus daqingensis TaxID=2486014 RepID=UPI000F79E532|nr:hypothetical protein [Lacticaseibacillus daqingensis]